MVTLVNALNIMSLGIRRTNALEFYLYVSFCF